MHDDPVGKGDLLRRSCGCAGVSRYYRCFLVGRHSTEPTERSGCRCRVPVGPSCGSFRTPERLVAVLLGRCCTHRCKLSDVDGNTEYEGEFIPYGDKSPVNADELKIDTEKTRDNK